jgi:hypothetical protein
VENFLLQIDSTLGDKPRHATAIIKLHGSVNWLSHMYEGEASWASTHLDPAEDTDEAAITSKNFDVDALRVFLKSAGGCEVKDEYPLTPVIVPPTLGKTSVAKIIKVQWRSAIEAFSRARHILVVGYSFPQTDTFMLRLLHEGLKDNNDLESLTTAIGRLLYAGRS